MAAANVRVRFYASVKITGDTHDKAQSFLSRRDDPLYARVLKLINTP